MAIDFCYSQWLIVLLFLLFSQGFSFSWSISPSLKDHRNRPEMGQTWGHFLDTGAFWNWPLPMKAGLINEASVGALKQAVVLDPKEVAEHCKMRNVSVTSPSPWSPRIDWSSSQVLIGRWWRMKISKTGLACLATSRKAGTALVSFFHIFLATTLTCMHMCLHVYIYIYVYTYCAKRTAQPSNKKGAGY